jgi:hypothetical protein
MKKMILSLVMLAFLSFPLISNAQNRAIDKLYEKYSGRDGFTSIVINKNMFELFSNIETDEENKDFAKAISGLIEIKILASDNGDFEGNFHDIVMKELPMDEYIELMVIRSKDQDVKFLIKKEKDGKISELLMISGGKGDDNALISIIGDIDMNTISKLSKTMGVAGLENLDKLDNDGDEDKDDESEK